MICDTCNKPHMQGKRVARARQTSHTCKVNKSHVQGKQVARARQTSIGLLHDSKLGQSDSDFY